MVDPFLPFLREQLDRYPDLPASRLHAMVVERGYAGGGSHFRRIIATLRPRKPAEAFQRLTTLPGEEAQLPHESPRRTDHSGLLGEHGSNQSEPNRGLHVVRVHWRSCDHA